MNGWFPKLNYQNAVISGNAGIWIKQWNQVPVQYSQGGTSPIWQSTIPIFNNNDGTSKWGGVSIPKAYNEYSGSDDNRWAGFSGGAGSVDIYEDDKVVRSIPQACLPRFANKHFGYAFPYQSQDRTLFLDDIAITTGAIVALVLHDEIVVFRRYEGNVPKLFAYWDKVISEITLHGTEDPQVAWMVDTVPWVMTITAFTGGVTFVRPLFGTLGYVINGALYYPDARMIDGKLYYVASDEAGNFKDGWIDFSRPMQDLKNYNPNPIPPQPIPPNPIPVPPNPIPPKPQDFATRNPFRLRIMEKKTARLRFPNQGKYVSVDRSKPTSGPFDGYLINFVDSPDGNCDFDLTQPDGDFALCPAGLPDFLGADATQYSEDLEHQLYTKKTREAYESWTIEWDSQRQFLLAYIKKYEKPFVSVTLAVEIQA